MTATSTRIFRTALLAFLVPASAFAQDTPKVGLVMGVPAAASVIWHITDRVAIRPEISFSSASTEALGADVSQSEVEPGFSVLFYTSRWDNVRAYVSPRYVYGHTTASSLLTDIGADSHDISGSVGAEFSAHRRFAVFGEVGLGYRRTTSDAGPIDDAAVSAWRVRTAVGVILYF